MCCSPAAAGQAAAGFAPAKPAPPPAYSPELQQRGGEALYRGDKLPQATGIRPEFENSGRWIARPSGTNGVGSGMPREIHAREAWLERYIRSANSEGNLSRSDTNRALRDLSAIRRSEQFMRRDRQNELSDRDEAAITQRLDRLSSQLRITNFEADRRN